MKLKPTLLLISLFCLLLLVQPVKAAKSYAAEQFDVTLSLQANGTLLVTETVIFNFTGGPFTYVSRNLALNELDSIDQIQANLEGVTLLSGKNDGQVEIEDGDPIKITWHFSATSDARRTFGLSYRVHGVVRKLDTDTLIWRAIPEDHDYPIGTSHISLTYPANVTLTGTPVLTNASGDIQIATGRVAALVQDISPDQEVILTARFQTGGLASARPDWQARQEEVQSHLRPTILIGGLSAALAVLLGIGGIVGFAQRYQREGIEASPSQGAFRYSSPPGDQTPAVATCLVRGRGMPDLAAAQAIFFDLAQRGILRIVEGPGRWLSGRNFIVQIQPAKEPLLPYEVGLLEALFPNRRNDPSNGLPLSQVSTRLASAQRKIYTPLRQALVDSGLLDKNRLKVRQRLLAIGVGCILFGGVLAVLALIAGVFTVRASAWSNLTTAGILVGAGVGMFLIGLALLIFSESFSPLSDQGEQLALQWKEFQAYLKDMTRGLEVPLRLDTFEFYLPFAAGFGLLAAWAKFFQKQGDVKPPAWFQPLQRAGMDDFAAFVVFSSVAHSSFSGSSHAGGGGSGASGGGSSSAG